jgi:16S rRNA (adenine1518-N6/adenine1519-N6)-dimethyltransferase
VADAVLMFQSELAERLTAGPGGRDYGRLSVLLGYYAGLTRLLELGPEVFYPRPKVRSTVLGLRFKASPEPAL